MYDDELFEEVYEAAMEQQKDLSLVDRVRFNVGIGLAYAAYRVFPIDIEELCVEIGKAMAENGALQEIGMEMVTEAIDPEMLLGGMGTLGTADNDAAAGDGMPGGLFGFGGGMAADAHERPHPEDFEIDEESNTDIDLDMPGEDTAADGGETEEEDEE